MLVLALACTSATGPANVLPPGIWGGDQANLIVTADSARVEFVCASGWLDAPVALDSNGRFEVAGQYRFEAGPVGLPVPAHWIGELQLTTTGSLVTLTGLVTPPGQDPFPIGPFHLVQGKRVTTGLCA
jgi:hypothetical protein